MGCDEVVDPEPCAAPEIIRSNVTSNTNNVLSAIVTANVRFADSVGLRYGLAPGTMDDVAPAVAPALDSVLVPLLGLHASSSYNIQLVAYSACGITASAVHTFTTSPLPSDLPKYTATGQNPAPGYVAFAAGNYGLVIDNTGRIVWYHRFPNGPGLNFQPQANGRYAARPNPVSSSDIARWVEIDPMGNVKRTLGCAENLQPRIHDLLAATDGSYWLLCDQIRTMDLSASGGSSQAAVLGTGVQHVSATGTLLFSWTPFDHFDVDLQALDPADRSGPVINWTHGNAIDLDVDGNLLVSFRNLSEVTKINTRTGAVMWRMGGARNQFTFENVTAPAFLRQHGLRATAAGRLQMLDNLGDPLASRFERYEYDEVRRTVRMISSIASTTGVVALIGGNTQNLAGGRSLVSYGNGGSVEETDAAGTVVWRIDGNPGYVFRAQRIRSLYKPGVGDTR